MSREHFSEEWLADRLMKNKPRSPTVRDSPSRSLRETEKVDAAPSKYRNKKTEVDGIVFASKKEAARYAELKLLERDGYIWNLRTQVPFEFKHNDVLICRYYADFQYKKVKSNIGQIICETIVEDVKGGKRTKEYIIKKKLMRAFYGIEILET